MPTRKATIAGPSKLAIVETAPAEDPFEDANVPSTVASTVAEIRSPTPKIRIVDKARARYPSSFLTAIVGKELAYEVNQKLCEKGNKAPKMKPPPPVVVVTK